MGGSRFLLTAVAFGVACGPGRVTPPQAPVSGDQTPREPVDASTPDTSPSADAGTTANPADGGMPQARLSVLCDSPDAPSGLTIDGFTWENPLPWGFEIAAAWSPSADEAWFIPAVPVGDAVRLLHRTPSGFEAVTAPLATCGVAIRAVAWGISVDNGWFAVQQLGPLRDFAHGDWDVHSALLRYDGHEWTVAWSEAGAKVLALAGSADGHVWAAGARLKDGYRLIPFVLRWDGQAWTESTGFKQYEGIDVTRMYLWVDESHVALSGSYQWMYYEHGPFTGSFQLGAPTSSWTDASQWQTAGTEPANDLWSIRWEDGNVAHLSRRMSDGWSPVSLTTANGQWMSDLPRVFADGSSWIMSFGLLGPAITRWDDALGFVPEISAVDMLGLSSGNDLWAFGIDGAIARRTATGFERVTHNLLQPDLDLSRAAAGQDVVVRPFYVSDLTSDGSPDGLWASTANTVLRRAAGRWQRMDFAGWLGAIGAVTSDDAWAVGAQTTLTGLFHWNGIWMLREILPCAPGNALGTGVVATRSDDVWTVACGDVWHYDGSAWRTILAGGAMSIWASSSQDAWVVRFYPSQERSALLHYDGASWNEVETGWKPRTDYYLDILRYVAGTAPDDVWVAGGGDVMMHWDGTSWSSIRSPFSDIRSLRVFQRGRPVATAYGMAARWDGGTWQRIQPPGLQAGSAILPTVYESPSGLGWIAWGHNVATYRVAQLR